MPLRGEQPGWHEPDTPAGGGFDRRSGFLRVCGSGSREYYLSVAARPWYAVHPVSSPPKARAISPRGVARSLDVAYPTTYYNGATDADAATPIPIKGGDQFASRYPPQSCPSTSFSNSCSQRRAARL